MTLNRVRPATINSVRLSALALFAIGIAVFVYLSADHGALARPSVASTIAWTGGFVLLAWDAGKRRTEETPGRLAPVLAHRITPQSQPPSVYSETGRKLNHPSHKSPVAEYTHQTSHF
jgi:hypothetical protein